MPAMLGSADPHLQPVYDTPLAIDTISLKERGMDPDYAQAHNSQHLEGLRRFAVGPMPVRTFIRDFLPTGPSGVNALPSKDAFCMVPAQASTVAGISAPLVTALNARTKRQARCPGLEFVRTRMPSSQPKFLGYMKPHIACILTRNAAIVQEAEPASRTELAYSELFIQLSVDSAHDFFNDPPSDLPEDQRLSHSFSLPLDDSLAAIKIGRTFGRHVAYAVEILSRQARAFLFSLSIAGSTARLFRWDRSGCIVTESFSLHDEPELLCDFLWRFAHASTADRGHDCAVRVATLEEEKIFRDAIKSQVMTQLDISGEQLEKAIMEHHSPGHAMVVPVTFVDLTEGGTSTRHYTVSRPVVSPLSLCGHGTKGYWAVDHDTGRVVFLKDTWRSLEHSDMEGDTIRRLNRRDVRNVPLLSCFGDVPEVRISSTSASGGTDVYECTRTAMYTSYPWACGINRGCVATTKRVHHRMVLDTVGYTLPRFRGTDELLHATYDAFIAMQDALTKDSSIHRDISINNIILVKHPGQRNRKGYLIDWGSSCKVDDAGLACEPGRAGAWPFMSWQMQRSENINRKQTFMDDMESLLYVVLYCALLWLPHNLTERTLTSIIRDMFEYSTEVETGVRHGGFGKASNAGDRFYTRDIEFRSAALQEWLNTAMDYHQTSLPWQEASLDKWSDPSHLHTFWAEFLETHTLESDDWVRNKLDPRLHWERELGISSSTSSPPPVSTRPSESSRSQPARLTRSSLGKRKTVEREGPSGRATTKRARALTDQPAAKPVRRAKFPPPGDVIVPRRSQRIQERLLSRKKMESELARGKGSRRLPNSASSSRARGQRIERISIAPRK
ncbi:hypothetical protein C8Q78DRAFT_1033476 [Trametes maxima]|nr:hypothetical protein C8Q78DRAFT_1033476 [Trametes maxima]